HDIGAGDLIVTKCGNAACSSGNTTTTVDSTDDVGEFPSIIIGAEGYPIISYYDNTKGDLEVVKCGNAACSSGNTITTVDSSNTVGSYTAMALGDDDLPIISYYYSTGGDLKVAKCEVDTCASRTTTTIDSTNDVGSYSSIAI